MTTVAGAPGMGGSADGASADARFVLPEGLAIDDAGDLLVADTGNSTIRKLAIRTGTVTTVAGQPRQAGVKLGPLPARLNQPVGLAVLRQKIFVADQNENSILRIQ